MVEDNRPRLKKVVINGVDVSAYVLRFIVTKEVSSPISSATILLKKSILTLLNVNKDNAIGKSVEIYRGVTSPDEEIIFRGEITNSKQDGNVYDLECLDNYNKAVRAEITRFYDKDISPEAGIISEIFKTNINDYTDLVADETSVQNTGTEFVLDKFWCNHADVFERNDALANTINWQHYYDEQTDKVRFEPKDYTINEELVLEVGSNIVEIPEWEYDTDEMINELTVKGSEQEVETTIFANGDGTENQKVVLPYTPISMKVYVGSGSYDPAGTGTKPSNNEGNLKEGGKIGAISGSYDYEYDDDPNIRTVYFKKTGLSQPSFIPPTGTNNIEIQYTKKLPTPVYGYDSQSIEKYGVYRTTHIKEDIKSTADAEVYLRKTLETYSKPFISTDLKVINATGLKIGAVYRIIDKYNDINEYVRVIKITKSYPYRYDEVSVGDKSLREYKWELSVMDRIKRLEELQSSSEDLLTHILPFEKSIGVTAFVQSLIRDLSVMKIPQDNLALELLFIGGVNDTSGNTNPVTNYGATLTDDRFGNPNDAYLFDGVDDYIEINETENPYLKVILLSPSTPTSDYQVKIILNTTNFDYSNCNSDGSDLRFYQTDNTELSYWIEKWNTSGESIIWVKVATSGTSSIEMRYGNPDASSASNGDNTFEFFDDFEGTSGSVPDNSKWAVEKKGSTSAVVELDGSGNLHLAGQPSVISSGNAKSVTTFTNGFLVKVKRKWSHTNYIDASIGNGVLQDVDNGGQTNWWHTTQGDGYIFFQQDTTNRRISKTPSGVARVDLDANTTTYGATNTWEEEEFIYDESGNLKWIHNGSEKLSAIDTTYLSTSKYLMFSQGEYSNGAGGDSYYDWVFVRKYASPEPSATVYSVGILSAEVSKRTYSFHLKATNTTDKQLIWAEGNATDGLAIYIDNNKLNFTYAQAGALIGYCSADFTSTEWNNIICIFDAVSGYQAILINNEVKSIDNKAITIPAHTGNIYLGDNKGAGIFLINGTLDTSLMPYNGKIDDVRVYNDALSSEDITQLYEEKVYNLDNGIISHWPLYTNTEDVVKENHGTGYNVVLTEGYTSVPKSAYRFNGSNSYIEVLDNTTLNPVDLSISVWIKINEFQDNMTIVSKDYDAYELAVTNAGRAIKFSKSDGIGGFEEISSNYNFLKREWYHIVLTFDSSSKEAKMYVDNSLIKTHTFTSSSLTETTPENLCFGASIHNGVRANYFNGDISDIRMYDKVLISEEISRIFEGGQNNRDIFILDHPQFSMLDRQKLNDRTGIKAKLQHYDNTSNVFVSFEPIELFAGSYTIIRVLNGLTEFDTFDLRLGETTGTFNIEYSIDDGAIFIPCNLGLNNNITFNKLMIKITAVTDTNITNDMNESEEVIKPAVYVYYY